MYCVKCGVKLAENTQECPLCHTVMHFEESAQSSNISNYSDRYPREDRESRYFFLGLVTTLFFVVALSLVILCLELYGEIKWSAYVVSSLILFWMIVIFPSWFRRMDPVVMVAVDFASILLFLYFLNAYIGQDWFFSFACPVVLYFFLVIEAAVWLFTYLRKGRLYVMGALCIAAGLSCLVIEYFLHVSFGTRMFVWSFYGLLFFGSFGLFLIIAAIYKPLGDYLERRFFI